MKSLVQDNAENQKVASQDKKPTTKNKYFKRYLKDILLLDTSEKQGVA